MTTEHVTVMFTDIVDSTALATNLRPDEADRWRRRHFDALRLAVAHAEGVEVKSLGDGLMAVFRAPSAALACAVAMQQAVESDSRGADVAIGLRVGLSAGEVVHEDDDYFGDPVIEAARLCAHCSGGQILANDIVRMTAGRRSRVACRHVGALSLKGLPDDVVAVEVVWEPLPLAGGSPQVLPHRLAMRPLTGLVGRTAEVAVLSDAFKRVAAGDGREVLLLWGEGGIGKSTLVGELARQAFADGAWVLFGHSEDGLAAPYQLFVEALTHLVEHASAQQLTDTAVELAPELVRLVPVLATRLPGIGVAATTDPDTERHRLFAAVVRLLASLARSRPVVLVLDDLQWADRASLQLLRHVVGADDSIRLLVVGTLRDAELAHGHAVVDTLADLHRNRRVTRIELRGLDAAGVAEFLEAAGGRRLDAVGIALAGELHQETGGNPFFVSELLQHLVETGRITHDDTGRWSAAAAVSSMALPSTVRTVVAARVGRLGRAAERVLTLAATLGREFDLAVLVGVAETTEDEVVDVLDEAAASALVREVGDSPGRYTFVHALIHHAVYEDLGPTRRARAHRRVAMALEALAGDRPDQWLDELARHWSAVLQPDAQAKALHYLRLAGDRALDGLAPDDALRCYAQALELHAKIGTVSDPVLGVDLTIGLGIAQRQLGHPAYRETLLDAARRAIALGDDERLATAALANNRGMFSNGGTVDEERVEVLELAIASNPADHRTRARLLGQLCSELLADDRFERRQELAGDALVAARASHDDATIVRVLNDICTPLQQPELLEQRLAWSAEALSRAETVGDPALIALSAYHRALVCMNAGDIAEVDRCHGIAWELADRLDLPLLHWQRAVMKAMRALVAGDADEAERRATEALEIGTTNGEPDAEFMYAVQLDAANDQRGRGRDKASEYEHALAALPGLRDVLTAALTWEHARYGRLPIARAMLHELDAGGFELPWNADWVVCMTAYAMAAVACGDETTAPSIYALLLPFADQLSNTNITPNFSVHHHLGALATVLGWYDEADAHHAAAAAFNERAGAAYFAAVTGVAWATMLAARRAPGDVDAARQRLAEARSLAVANGYADVERDIDELAATLT